MTAEDFAGRLAGGEPIAEPVALIVAHPDDECLWAGAALPRLERLLLIHITDGAPRDMADAHRLGFENREAYARARAGELDRALDALGVAPERLAYGFPDQEAVEHLGELVDRLARDCAGAAALVTHPYEGGHPDHDAAALAARLAAERIGRKWGTLPA
ncbi:MAG TPA: PIG-L family deacetylase, partial [Sphingomonas sp.]|nr:PIG-L family deacetylase [Sphingomonas sp.]